MFYQDVFSDALRFGDVLNGYVLASADVDDPSKLEEYKINIRTPQYCVVLSPCCSIGEHTIALTPLLKVKATFFDNPYLAKDLTRINRRMLPQQSVPPSKWEMFPVEEKARREAEGASYALFSNFVYEGSDHFASYTLGNKTSGDIETRYHMIDFKLTSKVDCRRINSAKDSPKENKILELSVETRAELRDKVANYFIRAPEADVAALE